MQIRLAAAPEAVNCAAGSFQHQGSSAPRTLFDNVFWHRSWQTGCTSGWAPPQAFWYDSSTTKPCSSISAGDPDSEGSTPAVRLSSQTLCVRLRGLCEAKFEQHGPCLLDDTGLCIRHSRSGSLWDSGCNTCLQFQGQHAQVVT